MARKPDRKRELMQQQIITLPDISPPDISPPMRPTGTNFNEEKYHGKERPPGETSEQGAPEVSDVSRLRGRSTLINYLD